jgi:hypothetical protein
MNALARCMSTYLAGVLEHLTYILTDLKTEGNAHADRRQQMQREVKLAKERLQAKLEKDDARLQEVERRIAALKVRSDIALQCTRFIMWFASLCDL